MLARPLSGIINVASMRNSVVLPAPFGPSSPVMAPSPAVNATPSTACTSPWRPNALASWCDFDQGRAPRRSGHSGGRPLFSKCSTQEARQRRERRIVDERRDEPRPAGVRGDDVTVAASDDVPACRQRLRDFGTVRRRRDRIEAAGQDQHRHVALDRGRRLGIGCALRPCGCKRRARARRASSCAACASFAAASAADTRGTSSAQVTE